jgi:hypothetical protein
MKKNILVLTLILSLLVAMPALASNSSASVGATSSVKSNKWQEVKNKIEEKKEDREEKREEKRELVRYATSSQTIVVRGALLEIKGIKLPTELMVQVSEAKVEKKSIPNTFTVVSVPSVNQKITVKVDEKTNFVRKYWGHNSIEELTVGDKLMMVIKLNDDGTYQGQMVKDESIYLKQKFIAGTVSTTSVGAGTVSVKVGDKNVVVKVDEETKIIKHGATSTVLSNLSSGDKILVKGVYNTNNDSVFARTIKVVQAKIWSLFGKK